MEEVVAGYPAVAECRVVGIEHELKGQVPLSLVVLAKHYPNRGRGRKRRNKHCSGKLVP